MEAQHTRGPWLVEPINGGETYQVTSAEDEHFLVIAETPIDGTGKDEANVRLIAAAPCLLAELEQSNRLMNQLWALVPGKTAAECAAEVKRQQDRNAAAIAKAIGDSVAQVAA